MSPSPVLQRRFAEPKTDVEIAAARAQGVPLKTRQDNKYCLGLWQAWRDHRNSTTGINFASLIELSTSELQHWFTRFILEVRKKNGDEFPPNTLHHMVCGIMRHLRWNGRPSLDLFSQSDFSDWHLWTQRGNIYRAKEQDLRRDKLRY